MIECYCSLELPLQRGSWVFCWVGFPYHVWSCLEFALCVFIVWEQPLIYWLCFNAFALTQPIWPQQRERAQHQNHSLIKKLNITMYSSVFDSVRPIRPRPSYSRWFGQETHPKLVIFVRACCNRGGPIFCMDTHTIKSINPIWLLATFVVLRSQSIVTGNPSSFSRSPCIQNSPNTRNVHYS